MAAPLAEKNANTIMDTTMQMHDGDDKQQCQDQQGPVKNVKSMEYHRQVLADRLARAKVNNGEKHYVSPSDGLMSPCTAKLSALRNKKIDGSVKPKSLFQKASARNLGSSGGSLFDSKPIASRQQTSGIHVRNAPVVPEPDQDCEMET